MPAAEHDADAVAEQPALPRAPRRIDRARRRRASRSASTLIDDEARRARIEAPRRLEGDQHLGPSPDLARDHDLLLIAAGQGAGRRIRARARECRNRACARRAAARGAARVEPAATRRRVRDRTRAAPGCRRRSSPARAGAWRGRRECRRGRPRRRSATPVACDVATAEIDAPPAAPRAGRRAHRPDRSGRCRRRRRRRGSRPHAARSEIVGQPLDAVVVAATEASTTMQHRMARLVLARSRSVVVTSRPTIIRARSASLAPAAASSPGRPRRRAARRSRRRSPALRRACGR